MLFFSSSAHRRHFLRPLFIAISVTVIYVAIIPGVQGRNIMKFYDRESEIESILEKNTGGFLDRLENEYNIIKRVKPVFAKEKSRT